jgi:putative heme-binding domain-containing protein
MMRSRWTLVPLAAGVLCVSAFGGFELAAQDHLGQYAQSDIVKGSQVYAEHCATCHGPNGNNIGTVNLSQGRFRLATSDDDLKRLIGAGIPAAGMLPIALDIGDLTAIVAYIRSGLDVSARAVSVAVGDVSRGRVIFESKGACLTCHRVSGRGSAAAPDLTDIGSVRTPSALQLTLIDPTAAMLPLNRPIRAVTRDGRTIRGRRLNEDTYTVQLIDEHEQLVTLVKADLRQYEIITVSAMPSYRDTLTKEEIADLLAYLISLRDNYGTPNPGRGRGAGMDDCMAPGRRAGDIRAIARCGERASQLADVLGGIRQ